MFTMQPLPFLALAIIILLTAVRTARGSHEDVFSFYAKSDFIYKCIGGEIMQLYLKKVTQASDQCRQMPLSFYSNGHPSKSTMTEVIIQPPAVDDIPYYVTPHYTKQNPSFSNVNWDHLFDPGSTVALGDRRTIPVRLALPSPQRRFNYGRNRRQLNTIKYYPEENVRILKNRVLLAVSNFTCVLKKLNYVNEQTRLEYKYMVSEIRSLGLPFRLQEDIVDGLRYCKDFTACLPVDQKKTSLPVDLKRVMTFLKCSEEQRQLACMKHDLRQQRDHFELQGLDQLLNSLEEDDQMLAIVWSDIHLNLRDEQHIAYK